MAIGFYHRSTELEAKEIIKKCVDRLPEIDEEPDDISIHHKQEASPADFIEEKFLSEPIFANHTEDGLTLDVEYDELNDKSKRKVRKDLIRNRGSFHVIEADVTIDKTAIPVSALVETKEATRDDTVEFYIEDYYQGSLTMSPERKSRIRKIIESITPSF